MNSFCGNIEDRLIMILSRVKYGVFPHVNTTWIILVITVLFVTYMQCVWVWHFQGLISLGDLPKNDYNIHSHIYQHIIHIWPIMDIYAAFCLFSRFSCEMMRQTKSCICPLWASVHMGCFPLFCKPGKAGQKVSIDLHVSLCHTWYLVNPVNPPCVQPIHVSIIVLYRTSA